MPAGSVGDKKGNQESEGNDGGRNKSERNR